ncbi:hypothetical protein [Gracilimonas sp.]|uniref:hypothetical protein n=1 Tax=Gracilimonas sp. TaxID=1974203 RepID=UPI0028725039|nr:hypothetical protein [Gracilimonas sp.]
MVTLSVGLGVGLVVLGVLGMIVSGIKSLMNGKQDFKRIGMMFVPFAVFGITYGVFGEVPKAGVFTALFMLGAMVLTITLTGLRGTFKF